MSEETRKILKELEVGTTYSGVDVICRQYKEIERLNNIINKLENILIKQIEEDKYTQNNKILFMRQEDKHILNTIKELKEGDKE